MQLTVIIPPASVFAADVTGAFSFITGVSLTDQNGNPLGNDVSKSSQVRIQYDFAIPNTQKVNSGDTYKLQIPNQIAIVQSLTIPIKDETGNQIATAQIGTNRQVVITFTDYASTHSNVKGYFYVTTTFDTSNIGNNNPQPIVFQLGGNSTPVTINVNFDQPAPLPTSVDKSGNYDASTNTITWTMKVNKEQVAVNNGQLVDNIPIGQQYVAGSASIDNGADGSKFSYTAAAAGDTSKTGTLAYTFPATINKTYNVTFKTKVTDPAAFASEGKTTQEYNTATLNHDGTATVSNQASVDVKSDYINKNGQYISLAADNNGTASGKINWTIKVNNNAQSLTNAKITDPIPKGLTLTPGSFQVDGKVSNSFSYNPSTNELQYTFSGTINEPHTITFSTDVTDSNAYNSNDGKTYTNTVTLSGGGVPGTPSATSNGVGVPTSVISKQGSGYNAATGEITWKITANSNKINIDNAVITDDIPVGQQYVDGSFTIDNGAPASGLSYTAVPGDSSKTGTLKYQFTGTINKTYIITFKTKVTDNKVFAANANKTYYNTATINGTNLPNPSSSTGNQPVSSEVINKSSTNYNSVTREITWSIRVNKNAMPINNAVVTDVINAGQDFVPGSVTINGNAADQSNYTYDSASKTFKYNFPAQITTQQVIVFKTKITDLTIFQTNGDKTLKNTASLSGDIIPPNVNDTSSKTIHNTVIGKSAQYQWGSDYIDWTINVNSNAIPLDTATIQDTLQAGLQLDSSSVALYKQTLNPDGSLTKGAQVALDGSNIKYDANRNFTFTFPGTIDGAYLLTFRTYITDASKSPFTNTASFKGTKVDNQSSTASNVVVYQGAGGGGSGETGSIKVVKVDSTNNSKTLSGAVFQLLDQYGNVISNSAPTGSDGSVTFSKLRFDIDYSVKEITAPTGYKLSNEVYKFQIPSSSTQKTITYNYKDSSVTGNIQFNKVTADTKSPLAGAEFSLYKDTDTGFQNPLANASSDSLGVVQFKNVAYGSYKIKETKAPAGYTLSTQVLSVAISEDGVTVPTTPGSISDTKITGGIKISKTDASTSAPVPGATITVYTSDGKPVGGGVQGKTGIDGTVEFDNLTYGDYYFLETNAPEGYLLNTDKHAFSIKDNGVILKDTLPDTRITGGIKITKADASTSAPVPGATITVYNKDGSKVGSGVEGKTGTDGTVEFDNLRYGDYYFLETNAPEGYLLNTDKHAFSIKDNGVILKDSLADTRITGGIKITKTDASTSAPVQGATITVYNKDGSKVGSGVEGKTGTDGTVEFDNLTYGDYYFLETNAPEGYLLNTDKHNFSIKDNGVILTDTLPDTRIAGNIQINKLGEDGNPLVGAEFTLYDNSGNKIISAVSDANGNIAFNNLVYGNYTVQETKAPEGYTLSKDTIAVFVSQNNATYSYKIDDVKIKGTIEFQKTGEDGNPLQGAEFTVYQELDTLFKNPLYVALSDVSGLVQFQNVVYGNYIIKETKAPESYNLSSQILTAAISEDGVVVKANPNSISDTKIRGTISIKKTDVNGNALQGAVFTLYDSNGKAVTTAVSGADGIASFTNVVYGSYTVKETKAAVGYNLSDKVIPVQVTENGKTYDLGNIPNTQITGGIKITKTDASTSAPVPGATITVYNKDGSKVGSGVEGVTGTDGTVEFDNLRYGDYYFVETNAPEGYLLNDAKHEFSIKDNGIILKDSLTDTRITGGIKITKTDASTSAPVPGATITVYNKDGSKVGSGVEGKTGTDGTVEFDNLTYGDYYFVETNAPEGYLLNPDKHPFSIKENGVIVKDSLTDTRKAIVAPAVIPTTPAAPTFTTQTTSSSVGINLPKTGSVIDTTVLILIGIIAIAAGVVLMFVKKRNAKV